MKARIIESKLSDGSEVYAVRVTYPKEFVLHFDMCDYAAALTFAGMFENADVSDAKIFSVTDQLHRSLKPI